MRPMGAGALLMVAALMAATGTAVRAQGPPKTLRIAVGIDADTLDPAGQTTTTVANMVDYVYETLVRADYAAGKVAPQLATSWTVSRDGLTYLFRLRQGVTFQDGTPFDAEAVKFTFDRLLDLKTRVPLRFLVDTIKEVQALDPFTVRFQLSKPSPMLLSNLTYTTTAIISPVAAQRIGAPNLVRDATGAGTGPYAFKEWVRGTHILVTRSPSYWGKAPVFDEVMFQVVPDAGTRETMLLAGDVHMVMLPPAPDVRRLRQNPNVTLVQAPTDRVIFIGLNTQWGPLRDARVRQAFNYAVNKGAILSSVLFDLGTVVDSPCPAGMFGYGPVQAGGGAVNPIKAKEMVGEAGHPRGFVNKFFFPPPPSTQNFHISHARGAHTPAAGIRTAHSTTGWAT